MDEPATPKRTVSWDRAPRLISAGRYRLLKILEKRGYEIRRLPRHFEPEFLEIFQKTRLGTAVSVHRCYAIFEGIRSVVEAGVPGVFVECGVLNGGSSMLAAMSFMHFGEVRDLYLYDTFAGMPEPTEEDRSVWGQDARDIWREKQRDGHSDWANAPVERVRANMLSTGYPEQRLHFVKGLVEDTIPAEAPDQIAVLRLDTDWYDSTKHEMEHLYPRLSPGGVLYVDDYGSWLGSRKAVDEYFAAHPPMPMLTRIDAACIGIKQG